MSFSQFWERVKDFIYISGWRIVMFFAVLLAGIIIIRITTKMLRRIFLKGPMDKSLGSFLTTVIKFFLYLALIFILAGIVGISMEPLTAILLSTGLVIALALQDSLSNVSNGLIIIASKPFVVGDYIEVAGVSGTVRKIGMITTELNTPDNRKISVPNSKIMNDTIINVGARPTRRVDLQFSVSRNSDLDLVKTTLYNALTSHPKTLDNPSPMVRMSKHTQSSYDYIARAWVNSQDYWDVYWSVTEQIAKDFVAKGIETPYNIVDVKLPAKEAEDVNK